MRMRVFAWFLLPALCAAGPALVVQGTVTHAITHQPLSGVEVRLVLFKNAEMNRMETFGAQSDRAGHFEVGGIRPGRYLVMPTLRGFVYRPAGPSADPPNVVVPIRDGLNQDLKIEMVPHSVISGRVLDGDGEPVEQALVQLDRVEDPALGTAVAQSDERGVFRVVTGPGRFYVKATYPGPSQPEQRTDGTVPFKPTPTYYPATVTREAAVVVEARAGAETSGIDIRMGVPGAELRIFGISGRITGLAPDHGSRTPDIFLREKHAGGSVTRGSQVSSDGRFRLAGLAPGDYELFASMGDRYSPSRTVTITNADLTDVELRLMPAITVSGRLTVKGDPSGPLRDQWKISFQPADAMLLSQVGARTAEVAADGSFQVTGVPALGVRAGLMTPPEGACISSLKINGAAARATDVITFPGRDSSVAVTVSRNCATISGVVKGRDGSVLRDATGFVVLLTDPVTNNPWQVPIAADGKFEFKAAPPGRYRVVALETVPSSSGSVEELRKLAARQKELKVKDGDRLTVDLTLIPREDINARQ